MSSSWFLVWVPARHWEKEQNSKSRSSDDYSNRERSCSLTKNQVGQQQRSCSGSLREGSRERSSCSRSSSFSSEAPDDSLNRNRPSGDERPVLKSLPAIQEDHDSLDQHEEVENVVQQGTDAENSKLATDAVDAPGDEAAVIETTAGDATDTSEASKTIAANNPNTTAAANASAEIDTAEPAESSSKKQEEPAEPSGKKQMEEKNENDPLPHQQEILKKSSSNYRVTAVAEDQTSSTITATTSCPDSMETSRSRATSPSSDKEDRLLNKQESYDSHARRGGSGDVGEGTPVTPLAGDVPVIPSTSTKDAEEQDDREFDKTAPFLEFEPMEDIVMKLLERLEIFPVSQQTSSNKRQVLFSFFVPHDMVEAVLLQLQNQGIGLHGASSVSVVPATIHYTTHQMPNVKRRESQDAKLDRFYSSVKSRLLVAEVIARIQAGAEFSFDFLILLVLAGMIAFMGLLENSSVVLVASMLVSPLMGPILAGIFGGVIQDEKLTRKGIIHETEALLICIGIGFLFGLIITPFAEEYGCPQWPTPEMMSRGELRSLWVGVLIAVPSGAGVALSVLGGNAGSLVGVAISASLLPPAVNAGIFWALAIVLAISGGSHHSAFHGFGTEFDPATNQTESLYQPRYSDDPAMESFYLGLVSLALTLLNILCIIFTGVLILRLKEVTPEKIPQKFSNFWRKDIKAHRNYYKTLTAEDNQKLLNQMESLGIKKASHDGLEGTFLQSMFDRAVHDNDLINIKEWVALPPSTLPPSSTNKPRVSVPEDEEALLSPNSNVTLSLDLNHLYPPGPGRSGGGGGHTAPVQADSLDMFPFQYATVHSSYNNHNNTFNSFLNVPNFFQSELRRSAVFRRRLYSAGDQHTIKPANI